MPQDIIPVGSFYPAQLPENTDSRDRTKLLFLVILKWRWLIFSLFLVFTIAAGVAALLARPDREATAKILLKEDRTPLQISGLSSRNNSRYSPEALQSEIELLESRDVLLPAAKELLSQRQDPPLPESSGWLTKLADWLSNADGLLIAPLFLVKKFLETYLFGPEEPERKTAMDKVEAKISSLRKMTVAVPIRNTNIIRVTYSAPTPEEAVKTLGVILNHYLEQHAVAYGGSAKLLSFYEQEQGRVEADLWAAEEQIRKWQEANDVVAIDNQISSWLEMLANQERALQETEAEGVMSLERDAVVTRLRSDLVTAEIALHDLLQRYTDEDRRVREKKEHIALLKKKLAFAEKALLSSLASQQGVLRKQIRQTSAAVAALREKKLEGERLSRIVDLHKAAFLLYGKNLEEARIAARLEREQLSNVAVIEQPHAEQEPGLKKRTGVVFLTAPVGLILGVAIAFGFEFFNNTLRMREDVEHYLGLPVLAAIPDQRNHHE